MAVRLGIELSQTTCRLVEVDGGAADGGASPGTNTHVVSFSSFSLDAHDRLAAFKDREAAVVVWGVRNNHRQVIVTDKGYDAMRAEALSAARAAGIETRGVVADIAPVGPPVARRQRRPVVLSVAKSDDLRKALAPLTAARIRVRFAVTPAIALMMLARSRRELSPASAIEAYVALDRHATCVALIRDGALFGARELPWGFLDGEASDASVARAGEHLAERLATELSTFFAMAGIDTSSVTQVSICGGMPEMRTMTMSLMERLDLEVEPLDSVFGIDLEKLPDPADQFRDQLAELRLAWVLAANKRTPINFVGARRRVTIRRVLTRAAIVAGTAAGLGLGWGVARSNWWRATEAKSIARTVARTPARPPAKPPDAAPSTRVTTVAPLVITPPKATPAPPPAPLAARATPPPVVTPPPPVVVSKPALVPAPVVPKPAAAPPVSLSSGAASKPAPAPPPAISATKAASPAASQAAQTKPTPTPIATSKPIATPTATSGPTQTAAARPTTPSSSSKDRQSPVVSKPTSAGSMASAKPPLTSAPTPAPTKPVTSPPAAAAGARRSASTSAAPVSKSTLPYPLTSKSPVRSTKPTLEPTSPTSPPPSRIATTKPLPPPPAARNVSPVPPVSNDRAQTVARPPTAVATPPAVVATKPIAPAPAEVKRPTPSPTASASSSLSGRSGAPPSAPATEGRPAAPLAPPSPPGDATDPNASRRPAKPEPPPTPFDAVLGTILYAPGRKLAVVDGRIVQPGDEVRGARVIDITPTTVLLRDGRGQLRQLTVGGAGR